MAKEATLMDENSQEAQKWEMAQMTIENSLFSLVARRVARAMICQSGGIYGEPTVCQSPTVCKWKALDWECSGGLGSVPNFTFK